MTFDYSLDFKKINFRNNPELYQIGRGEQGVLSVEPYKSEILPNWRFRTPEIAEISAAKIYQMFLEYKSKDDFVGMDMARKFLQMGYTRSRRYANHKSGKKYSDLDKEDKVQIDKIKINSDFNNRNQAHAVKTKTKKVLPQEPDALTNEKAQSAKIFYGYYLKAKEDEKYIDLKQRHKDLYK